MLPVEIINHIVPVFILHTFIINSSTHIKNILNLGIDFLMLIIFTYYKRPKNGQRDTTQPYLLFELDK